MKIILGKETLDAWKEKQRKAREGCDKCPGCGETSSFHVVRNGTPIHYEGIQEHRPRTFYSGFFGFGPLMRVDKYECKTCGVKWESDPYPDQMPKEGK